MSAVMAVRKKYKDAFKEKHDVGLGFMSFFTKAVVQALQEALELAARQVAEAHQDLAQAQPLGRAVASADRATGCQ